MPHMHVHILIHPEQHTASMHTKPTTKHESHISHIHINHINHCTKKKATAKTLTLNIPINHRTKSRTAKHANENEL